MILFAIIIPLWLLGYLFLFRVPLFRGGFRKETPRRRDPGYLERFRTETGRGEAVHWTVRAAAGFFLLWNPPAAGLAIVAYGAAANLPCIIVQRYNRLRLGRVRT